VWLIKNTTITSDIIDKECNAQSILWVLLFISPSPLSVGANVFHDVTYINPKRGGHPKGEPSVASHAEIEQRELLLDSITAEWSKRVEID
jgi:hypothetical protein